MPKTPELPENMIQDEMFEELAPKKVIYPKPQEVISPPHIEEVIDYKRSREKLLTPEREPDIHEKFQEIQAIGMADHTDIKMQVESQGISGIATITTPKQESMLAGKIEKEAGRIGGKIPVLSANPDKGGVRKRKKVIINYDEKR